jgi:hypothetical protein
MLGTSGLHCFRLTMSMGGELGTLTLRGGLSRSIGAVGQATKQPLLPFARNNIMLAKSSEDAAPASSPRAMFQAWAHLCHSKACSTLWRLVLGTERSLGQRVLGRLGVCWLGRAGAIMAAGLLSSMSIPASLSNRLASVY